MKPLRSQLEGHDPVVTGCAPRSRASEPSSPAVLASFLGLTAFEPRSTGIAAFRGVLAVLLAGVALSLSEPAFADPPHPPRRPQVAESPRVSSSISVEMKCVRGTNDNAKVDDSLKSILPALSQTNYRGFSLVDSYRDNLSDGQETEFSIEGGRKVKIELLDHDQTKARVRIRMFNGQGRQALDTTVSIHRDRSFMVAGPKVGDDVLILPVTVRY